MSRLNNRYPRYQRKRTTRYIWALNHRCLSLRIDNSRHGVVHVLWNFSRTKISTKSCDRSNERAYFSACVDANGILINLELKKIQI